jgi:inhibitor of cysteine peptidase
MQTFSFPDDGKHLQVKSGELFALELPETPTTGFRWSIAEIPPTLRLSADDFVAPASAVPGASGTHHWIFEAIATGAGQLLLELNARTQRDAPARSFRACVEVVGD